MQDSPSSALRLLVTNNAIVIRRDTAEVLRVVVGDVGAATDTEGVLVCTNVPTHVMTIIIGTSHVVVADDLTLCISSVEWTVLGTLVMTRL